MRRLDDFSFNRRVQLIKIDVEFMELQAPKISGSAVVVVFFVCVLETVFFVPESA